MHVKEVQKLHIALEELEDALQAYFNGRFHSATVLAGAAEELFAGYLLKHGLTPAWLQDRAVITKIANGLKQQGGGGNKPTTEKEIGDLLNYAYNHSKHAGTKDHEVRMNPREEARMRIDRAISNYDQLCGRPEYDIPDLPLAQRFITESVAEAREK